MVETITLISAITAGFSAIIALSAERRVRQIKKRVHLSDMLVMYVDIGYGNVDTWPPWDVAPNNSKYNEYQQWLTRFYSYNGRVNEKIRDDYEYVVEHYLKRPNNHEIETIEVPNRMHKVREYALKRVKELGAELGDDA